MLINRYDAVSTGANTHETILNVTNVNRARFGKRCTYYVDGAVYAQPLYTPAVAIPARISHNVPYTSTVKVLYVATMNDKFYAFDADRPGPPLWMRGFTDELNGIVPVPVADLTNRPDLNVVGNVGILETPAIDPSAHAMRGAHAKNGAYVQRLRKLDLATARISTRPPSSPPASRVPPKTQWMVFCTRSQGGEATARSGSGKRLGGDCLGIA